MRVVPKNENTHHSQPYTIVIADDLITITMLKGKITGGLMRSLRRDFEIAAKQVRQHGKRPVALVDASVVRFSDVASGARTEGRSMLSDIPIERLAVFGTSNIGILIDYLGRAASMGDKLKYFSNRRGALAWLRGEVNNNARRSSVGLIAGIIIALIGLLGLIGWHTGNYYLTSLLPSLRPINPVAATGFIALGVAFFCYWQGALKPLRLLGWTGILLGIAALLPLNIDTILFADAIQKAGLHTYLADSAAICFILSGILGLLANREAKWVQPTEYLVAGIMLAIALFNVYGLLYATEFIYSISDSFGMALNTGLAFIVAAIAMIILVVLRRTRSALNRVTRSGWLIVIALVFVQVATYASWSQATDRQHNDALHAFSTETTTINDQVNTRLQAYVNALHGFRGLFVASTNVSQGDFEAYHDSLNLKQTYPGVRAIAFIAAVETKNVPTFIAERRQDTSLHPAGNPDFKVQGLSQEQLHFIGAFTADSPTTTALGRDLTLIPGRSAIYNNALRSNGYYSSGTITFAATGTAPASEGFFIATPVQTATSSQPIGVVTANFNYNDFFDSVLKSVNHQNLSFSVRDNDTGKILYTSGKKLTGDNLLTQKLNISLAQNQSWQVIIQAPETFGATSSQQRTASSIVFVGQIFTLLLGSIFIIQIRARGQALALADAITEDLQVERDNIAALHSKDEAMLAGIGEGLIFIDKNGKIEVTNEAATRLLGYSDDELIGSNLFETLRALDEKGEPISVSKRPAERALRHSKITTTRLTYIRKDYRQVPVKVTVAPIILHGQLIGAIEVFSDITREKQLEHMKDEFLSVASHELRTPMGAIRANLSMILSGDYGPVNKDLVEPLSDMKNSTIRLVELVSDLLNVARIEAGRMKFDLTSFDIKDTTKTVVNDLAPLGKEKGVDIVAGSTKTSRPIQGDVDKVKQVLTNLIGNSLKFTDTGSITVSLISHDDNIEVNVTDTGIGISPEDQAKLFGKFNQITSAQAGKPAGTGLGLYISREMVRKMGGDMWIKQSALMQGSTFAFTLPYVDASSAKKAKHEIAQESKLHPDQV